MALSWSTRYSTRRGIRQWALLAAVAGVIVTSTTTFGVSTLLLSVTADEGFVKAVEQSPVDLEVTVPATADASMRAAVTQAAIDNLFAPLEVDTSTWATSQMWYLPRASEQSVGSSGEGATSRIAYLGAYDDVETHASLTEGRWAQHPPEESASRAVVEAVMPATASEQFDIVVGDTVDLSTPAGEVAISVEIVGTYEAVDAGGAYWSHDLLAGQGYDSDAMLQGSARPRMLPTSGALLVSADTLADPTVPFETMAIASTPRIDQSDPADLESAAAAVSDARQTLRTDIDPDATAFSSFPESVAAASENAQVTRSIVVIALLIAGTLCASTVVLAARLLGSRRSGDRDLLISRGASPRQLAQLNSIEAVALAAVGAVLGPPLALLAYRWLLTAPFAAKADLDVPSGIPAAVWLACAATAVIIAALFVAVGSSFASGPSRSPRRGAIARSGLDVALLIAAAIGVTQLALYGSPASRGNLDIVLALTPVACLAAGAAIAVRAVPLLGAVMDRRLPRTSAVVAPMAAWSIGRRSRSVSGAVFLLTLAVAAATFAPGFIATWRTSQVDQADLAVGTDVRVDGMSAPVGEQAKLLATAGAQSPSPVARSRVSLGSAGSNIATQQASEILGVDASAPQLLQGRAPHTSWAEVTQQIDPPLVMGPEFPGKPSEISLSASGTLTPVGGVAPGEEALRYIATLTVMLRDSLGATWPVEMPSFDLDGAAMTVSAAVIPDAATSTYEVSYPLTVDAVVAHVEMAPGQPYPEYTSDSVLSLTLGTATGGAVGDSTSALATATAPWELTVPRDSTSLLSQPVISGDISNAAQLDAAIPGGFVPDSGIDMVLTPYSVQDELPVVISAALAQDIGATPGTTFSIAVAGGGAIDLTVAAVLDYLPTLPSEAGIMIDLDGYTRAAIADGSMTPPMTGWQMSVPPSEQEKVTDQLIAAHVGVVDSRLSAQERLLDSPSRVGVQLAAVLVAVAAVTLGIAGFALHLATALDQRRGEQARLFGLGVTRRTIRRIISLETAIVGALAGVFGLSIGAITNALVSAHLAVSPSGSVPIPGAVTVWPWMAQMAVVAIATVLFAIVVTVLSARAVAHIRTDVLSLGDDS